MRGGKKGKEIDIVVNGQQKAFIEVKYREGAPVPNDNAIVEHCDEANTSIIVTKNAQDYGVHQTPQGTELLRIPAYAFLYLLGWMEKNGNQGNL